VCAPEEAANTLQKLCRTVEDSPFIRERSKSKRYTENKGKRLFQKIGNVLSTAAKTPIHRHRLQEASCDKCDELVSGLQSKFERLTTKCDKYRLLTVASKQLNIAQLIERFKCSTYMARTAKHLCSIFGPFSEPERSTSGHYHIPASIKALIREFYLSAECSRILPGQRDTILVKTPSGDKLRVEKRQMLMSLSDFFAEFKNHHPEAKVSMSSVAMMKPKECYWPGRTGFKRTCLCEIHQKFRFTCRRSRNSSRS